MSGLNNGQGKRSSDTSRNTDNAQASTPESDRLDDAMSTHDEQSREQVKPKGKLKHQQTQQQQTRQEPSQTNGSSSTKGKRAQGGGAGEQARDMQTAQGTSEQRQDDSSSIGSESRRDQGERSDAPGASMVRDEPSHTAAPENDRNASVAEGNYNAADGHHTEEVPRTKGKHGTRVSTTDGSWSSTSQSKRDKH